MSHVLISSRVAPGRWASPYPGAPRVPVLGQWTCSCNATDDLFFGGPVGVAARLEAAHREHAETAEATPATLTEDEVNLLGFRVQEGNAGQERWVAHPTSRAARREEDLASRGLLERVPSLTHDWDGNPIPPQDIWPAYKITEAGRAAVAAFEGHRWWETGHPIETNCEPCLGAMRHGRTPR